VEPITKSAQAEEPAGIKQNHLVLIAVITFSYKTVAARDRYYAGPAVGAHTIA
jgi:hypothetical protein